jgi:hypothetical protein
LRTDTALLRALKAAAGRKLSADEKHRQRVSYIMGMVKPDSGSTRARVEQTLAEQDGKKVAQVRSWTVSYRGCSASNCGWPASVRNGTDM